jgi:inner membrane protein
MGKTHIAFATSLALAPTLIQPQIINSIPITTLPIIALGLFLGSLFPDIDEPNSKISRMTLVTLLFSWILVLLGNKHRGITHRFIFLLFFIIATLISYRLIPTEVSYFLAFFTFGIFAHHLGDMMVGGGKNKGGIYNYFSPFVESKSTLKFLPKVLRCKINGTKEHLYLFIFASFSSYTIFILTTQALKQ